MSMTLEKLHAVRAEMDRLEDRLRTVRRASLDLTRALAELRKP